MNVANLRVGAGNSLGDVRISGLFLNNNAFLEIGIRKLQVSFFNIHNQDDILAIKDCAILLENAWTNLFPDIEFSQRIIDLKVHSSIDGGRQSTQDLIEKLISVKDVIDINGTDRTIGFVANYEQENERWSANMMLDKSALISDGLFFHLRAIYTCDGEFKSFDAQAAHFIATFESVLRGLNLQAASD